MKVNNERVLCVRFKTEKCLNYWNLIKCQSLVTLFQHTASKLMGGLTIVTNYDKIFGQELLEEFDQCEQVVQIHVFYNQRKIRYKLTVMKSLAIMTTTQAVQ